jgi:hypothetical protein
VKLLPVTVTVAPTGPEVGDKPVMAGDGVTVKLLVLLPFPLTVTTTLPDVAPAGTWTCRLVALHETQVTGVPLNVTVLVPCDAPKPLPTMATNVPTGPDCGVISCIAGAASAGLAVRMQAKKRETARIILTAASGSDLKAREALNHSAAIALSDLSFMSQSPKYENP